VDGQSAALPAGFECWVRMVERKGWSGCRGDWIQKTLRMLCIIMVWLKLVNGND